MDLKPALVPFSGQLQTLLRTFPKVDRLFGTHQRHLKGFHASLALLSSPGVHVFRPQLTCFVYERPDRGVVRLLSYKSQFVTHQFNDMNHVSVHFYGRWQSNDCSC
ncbi:hypothetical protein BaRGS_00028889 [Batillaria attramentaria]|uniref:Uncharacterized protein n=1 Tax=Batillaria attramentaria TaxID=370345 RepID=A0ABD0JY35_9CAEN